MCGGGGGGGPSASDQKKQKQWQRKVFQRQNKQFHNAQKNAQAQADANLAFNKDQYAQGRKDSWDQFNISQKNQVKLAAQQMSSQQAQFAAAQAAQQQQLQQQLAQNQQMALEAEKAANRAAGMKAVNGSDDIVKVKSKAKSKNRRIQATLGTSQLTIT